ncbi:antichymotrypsin-1 [Manduca sexta]|uniref:antichymotrypsin-1 n=1 Tax=Manduca sexta TaxID=7130 RepID=UPI0018906180|nr:antichymotrypsin-1 [Manduca sexta]
MSVIPRELFLRFRGPEPIQRTPLGDAIDKATLKLLQEAFISSSDKNVVTSPLGVMILLSLYNTGAGEETQQEINNYLGGACPAELAESYSGLSRKFSTLNPECLTVANKIYVNNKFTLWEKFSEIARNSYHSGVDKINVQAPAAAAALINEWAENMTRGHIKNAMAESDIKPSVTAVLINVIFFQGHWSVPFKATDTKEKDFHTSDGNVIKKPMMHLLRAFKYTKCANIPARMIELPYKEEGFRMIVVLPNEIDGLPAVVEQVAKTGLLDDIFNLRVEDRVDLDMPKFNIENSLDLQDLLSKIGVKAIFSEAAPGIVKDDFINVTKAIQKAFVKVDEEGAIAGAFTAFVTCRTTSVYIPPPPVKFTVDRPFLFMILHEDIILFVGTLSK